MFSSLSSVFRQILLPECYRGSKIICKITHFKCALFTHFYVSSFVRNISQFHFLISHPRYFLFSQYFAAYYYLIILMECCPQLMNRVKKLSTLLHHYMRLLAYLVGFHFCISIQSRNGRAGYTNSCFFFN